MTSGYLNPTYDSKKYKPDHTKGMWSPLNITVSWMVGRVFLYNVNHLDSSSEVSAQAVSNTFSLERESSSLKVLFLSCITHFYQATMKARTTFILTIEIAKMSCEFS